MVAFVGDEDTGWINLANVARAEQDGTRVALYDVAGKLLGRYSEFAWQRALADTNTIIPDRTGAIVWVVGLNEDDKVWQEDWPILGWRANECGYLEPVTFGLIDSHLASTYIIEQKDSGEDVWRWYWPLGGGFFRSRHEAYDAVLEHLKSWKPRRQKTSLSPSPTTD